MRPIDADALDTKIYNEIPIKVFGTIKRMAAIREIIAQMPTVGGWISVKDSTPTVMYLDCWVIIKGCPNPIIDLWVGDRGEESTGVFPDGEKTFVKSGWYCNDCNEVTHWMPIYRPEPPKEVSGDADGA